MHELAVALGIVDAACDAAGGARVTAVVVEVGALTGVAPDALRFSFDAAARGTLAAGATLEVREVAAVGVCGACGGAVRGAWPVAVCACGGGDVAWRGGHELRVVELEVA